MCGLRGQNCTKSLAQEILIESYMLHKLARLAFNCNYAFSEFSDDVDDFSGQQGKSWLLSDVLRVTME